MRWQDALRLVLVQSLQLVAAAAAIRTGGGLEDCAAVEEAESRTSYAETLLAFATRTRWPMTGVAMAGTAT